jgi:predicted nuclease of restriction endonuclease-like (RecB) superfamily
MIERTLSTLLDNRDDNTVLQALKRLLPEACALNVTTGIIQTFAVEKATLVCLNGGMLMKRRSKNTRIVKMLSNTTEQVTRKLFGEIRSLIETSRAQVVQAVNSTLVMLYWRIGTRIRKDILGEERAEYGKQIVSSLSKQLVAAYGSGFSEKSLRRMIQFAEVFPNHKIVASLMRQLSWTHFLELIPLKDELQREFYAEMCRVERWSVRTLREKIASVLYERTAISKKPDKLIKQELKSLRDEGKLTPDLVFRDPYVLDFLGLKDTYSEKDFEAAILREIESFILELGVGFSFITRQKRITVDGEDYYLDLLFFHRSGSHNVWLTVSTATNSGEAIIAAKTPAQNTRCSCR